MPRDLLVWNYLSRPVTQQGIRQHSLTLLRLK